MNVDLTPWVGKPFAWFGRGPDHYDCWGLTREVLLAYGHDVPDYLYDASTPSAVADLVEYVKLSESPWKLVETPEPGDLVMMGATPRVHHAGVYTELGVIHTSERTGVLIQPMAALRRSLYRCVRFYRWAA
jgi:cell wall-associated NlpC family hydrolase